MIFIGTNKAYDNVPRNRIWQTMRMLGIIEKFTEILKQFLFKHIKGSKNRIFINLKQGSTLLLFIYLDHIFEKWPIKAILILTKHIYSMYIESEDRNIDLEGVKIQNNNKFNIKNSNQKFKRSDVE